VPNRALQVQLECPISDCIPRIINWALLGSLALISVGLQDETKESGPSVLGGIPLKPADCILTLDGKNIRPIRYGPGDPVTTHTVEGDLILQGTRLKFRSMNGVTWTKSDAAADCICLASDAGIAYLTDSKSLAWEYDDKITARVLRLNLRNGEWLKPIPIQNTGESRARIDGLALHNGKIALLTAYFKQDDIFRVPSSFNLTVLSAGTLAKKWSCIVPISNLEGPGGMQAWPRNRGSRFLTIRTIQWADDGIIVCPDATGPIVSFKSDGTQAWRLDRPWEFGRGFIGPSVYQYFIGRSTSQVPPMMAEDPAKPAPVDKTIYGRVIAGPIWTPGVHTNSKGWGQSDAPTLFIPVGRGQVGRGTEDCVVYEIDGSGAPVSETALPQFVTGGTEQAVSDGLVWPAGDGAMIRMKGAAHRMIMQIGPFESPNLTAMIDWLVQDPPRNSDERYNAARFSSGTETDLVAYTGTKSIRFDEGWSCPASKGVPVVFPVKIVDLATGLRSTGTLSVPLSVPIKRPQSNYMGQEDHFATFVPLIVEVRKEA